MLHCGLRAHLWIPLRPFAREGAGGLRNASLADCLFPFARPDRLLPMDTLPRRRHFSVASAPTGQCLRSGALGVDRLCPGRMGKLRAWWAAWFSNRGTPPGLPGRASSRAASETMAPAEHRLAGGGAVVGRPSIEERVQLHAHRQSLPERAQVCGLELLHENRLGHQINLMALPVPAASCQKPSSSSNIPVNCLGFTTISTARGLRLGS